MKLISILSLPQWLKNLLILVPAIFGQAQWDETLIYSLLIGFFGFSLLSSAVYLHNDLADRAMDALHPEKSKRPLPSGALSVQTAWTLLVLLSTSGSLALWWISLEACAVGLTYVALNILYTWVIKNLAILDVLFLIQGYWLRLILGGVISGLALSGWVLGVVALMASYLVIFKRYGDAQLYIHSGKMLRKSIPLYAALPLQGILRALAGLIALSFFAYVLMVFHLQSAHFRPWVYASVPLAWWALYRFHIQMQRMPLEDPLLTIFRDAAIVLPAVLSFAVLCVSLYFP